MWNWICTFMNAIRPHFQTESRHPDPAVKAGRTDWKTSSQFKKCFILQDFSFFAEKKVRQKVRHVLIEFIFRGEQHWLVVNEEQQKAEEEQKHNACKHHQNGRNAVLLGTPASAFNGFNLKDLCECTLWKRITFLCVAGPFTKLILDRSTQADQRGTNSKY